MVLLPRHCSCAHATCESSGIRPVIFCSEASCLRHAPLLQVLKNTGSTPIAVPYTLAIFSPSYALITGSAWNWEASGSANGGTLSGAVTMVRPYVNAMPGNVCF